MVHCQNYLKVILGPKRIFEYDILTACGDCKVFIFSVLTMNVSCGVKVLVTRNSGFNGRKVFSWWKIGV